MTFETRDANLRWPADLGAFGAIVTLQAAHETRHKRHLSPLLERTRTVLAPGGGLIYADYYLTPENKLRALAPAPADSGLRRVRLQSVLDGTGRLHELDV